MRSCSLIRRAWRADEAVWDEQALDGYVHVRCVAPPRVGKSGIAIDC
jgi:hypothetical protein